jgi:hypothetical protein
MATGNKYEEVQESCESVRTTFAEDRVAYIEAVTNSEPDWTFIIGFQSEDFNNTVRLNKYRHVTLVGVERWRCTTRDDFGLDRRKVINASRSTVSHYIGREVGGDDAVSDDSA